MSDGITTVDGVPIERGRAVEVRSGVRIGVAGVLTLQLLGADRRPVNDDDVSTTLWIKGQRAGAAEPEAAAPTGSTGLVLGRRRVLHPPAPGLSGTTFGRSWGGV